MFKYLNIAIFKNNAFNRRGFGLIETTIALFLGSFLAVTVAGVFIIGLKGFRELKRKEYVQAEAIFIADSFVNMVKQGERFKAPDPATLEIILPDLTVRTIALDGESIELDGKTLNSARVKVTALTFTPLTNSVRISAALESVSGDEAFSFTTSAAKRNNL